MHTHRCPARRCPLTVRGLLAGLLAAAAAAAAAIATAAPPGPATPPCPPIAAPRSLVASDGAFCEHTRISWSAVPGAVRYTLLRGASPNAALASQLATLTTCSFQDSTAAPGATYHYWVAARNACGSSSPLSAGDTGIRRALPYAPSLVSAADGDSCTQVAVRWSLAPYATRYRVTRHEAAARAPLPWDWQPAAGATQVLGVVTGAVFVDATPTPGKSYIYTVTSLNSYGDGDAAWDAGFCGAPIPQLVSAVFDCRGTMHVSWSSAPGVALYEIFRLELTTVSDWQLQFPAWRSIGVTTEATFADPINNGLAYRVRSLSGCGWSADSAEARPEYPCGWPF